MSGTNVVELEGGGGEGGIAEGLVLRECHRLALAVNG